MSSYATNPLHQFPLEMECKWLRRKRERKEREREGEWNLWEQNFAPLVLGWIDGPCPS